MVGTEGYVEEAKSSLLWDSLRTQVEEVMNIKIICCVASILATLKIWHMYA